MAIVPQQYIQLRTRLAHHALRQVASSLKNSLKILIPLCGIGLPALVAFLALPSLYALTLTWPAAICLIFLQAILAATPVLLLGKRLLPDDIKHWLLTLPLPVSVKWQADIAVARIFVTPLAIAYAFSLAIWLYQWPVWLRPIAFAGVAVTVASLLLTWLCAAVIMALRARAPRPQRRRKYQPESSNYEARVLRPHDYFLWRQLFWLPCWRCRSFIGVEQIFLFFGAIISMLAWLLHMKTIPAPMFGMITSALMIITTERGKKAVQEQIMALRPVMLAWPINAVHIERWARLFSLLPALIILGLFGAMLAGGHSHFSHKTALVYLGFAAVTQIGIVIFPRMSEQSRVGLLFFSILMLTSIGSELWN